MTISTHSAYPAVEWGRQGVTSLWCATQAPQHLCWLLSAPWGLPRSSAEAESTPLAHGVVRAPHLPLWAGELTHGVGDEYSGPWSC